MAMLRFFALISIAILAVNSSAAGTNVYKCGSTYSQTPCDGTAPVRMDDSRSQKQKAQSEAVAKNQARTANSLEKTRLKEEAQALAQAKELSQANAKAAALANKKKAVQATADASNPTILSAPTNKSKNKKEPQYFTAKESAMPRKSASSPGK